MNENTSVSLNLQSPNISTVVYAVQNDRLSRHIVAQLLDGSAPWTPPVGAGAFIRYLKPDGTGGFYDVDESNTAAISVSGSVATLTLAEQCTTVPGDVYMQLNFYGTDGSKLTTFAWILRVQKSVLTDATIVSSDYYNVLSEQIGAVLNAAESLTGMTASASGLATGANPTVAVTGGSGGTPYNLAFGIPAGPVGPANNASGATTYQAGASPSTPPTGTWQSTPPSVNQGNYLWSKTVVTWASGTPTTYYSVARQGVDGSGSPGTSTPLMDGTAAVGTATNFSREDHVHPKDTSKLDASYAPLHVSGTISGSSTTISDTSIIAGMDVVELTLGTPDAITSGISWTVANGSITLSCTVASGGSSTVDIVLVKADGAAASGNVQIPISIVETGTTTDSAGDTWNYRKYSNGDIDLWINKDNFSFSGSDTTLNGWHRRIETRTLSILSSILWVSATGANSNYILTGALPETSNSVQFIQSGISATAAALWVVCHIKGRYA